MRVVFLLVLAAAHFAASRPTSALKYDSIFNFGDSLSDTGNLIQSHAFPILERLPFGQTFFRRATGRCSDGRLIIDFLADAAGLPYLPPYLALRSDQNDVERGVNFAVAGATALDSKFFYDNNMGKVLWTNNSLNVQVDWFKKLRPSLCSTKKECDEFFSKSLFVVGEIGGNDLNFQLFVGVPLKQARSTVPAIVEVIKNATSELIEQGAVTLMVPGNIPTGCSPLVLTIFQSPNQSVHEKRTGCFEPFNNLIKAQNREIKKAVNILRKKHPHARIIYADLFGAAMTIYEDPKKYGFTENPLRACCGGGGPYNFNNTARCGHEHSTVCPRPSSCVSWDGIHLTDAANHHIANELIRGNFTSPPLRM